MTSTLVIDSSVIVKWLNTVNEEYVEQANKILEDALLDRVILIAPELAKYEVGNVLLLGKKVAFKNVATQLETLHSLPIAFIAQSLSLTKETYRIAETSKITYYDAAFIALAKQEKATLVTDNIKHQGRVSEVKVIPLKNYK